ncbi:MAG: hypothetical protein A2X48_04330 [Lentisphaerae bacterium GWF2_49_21]|nr:MAG: hypothetical protein A2X48_04330 [Lentisphaerae bacterium GWF2_49_21]
MFIELLGSNPNFYFMCVLIVIFSVCCHEYMHARAALWQGDSTAADLGHLTLNPLKQMGAFPIIMLLIIGITWGQVPVNPSRMKHRYSDALVSFAGPFANLMLFLVFSIATAVVLVKYPQTVHLTSSSAFGALLLFYHAAMLNILLFIFNMLPIPILDGYNVFSFMFPGVHNINQELKNGMIAILFILVLFTFDKLQNLCYLITQFAVDIFRNVLGFIA